MTIRIMMMNLGIIGYYITKIYDEIKEPPKYIVTESTCEELIHPLNNKKRLERKD